MPIYEYKCEKCGNITEFLVGVCQSDAPVKCKSCGSDKMQKVLSRSFVSSGKSSDDSAACPGCDYGASCDMESGCPSSCPRR